MDFKEQLKKQLRFLQNSCEGYDAGDKDEAVRIATTLRVLFHQPDSSLRPKKRVSKSTSLLSHLKSPYIKLLSTCEVIPKGAKFWPNLTVIKLWPMMRMAEYAPKLDTAKTKKFVAFGQWWRYETVYLVGSLVINRRDLVLGAANKDGGAHVDEKLDSQYETILNGAGWKMTLNEPHGDEIVQFQYGHLAALRQMGHEVLNSPDLLTLA